MSAEETISARLEPVLAAVAERIHYAEGRRTNYSVMAAAFIAAALTILTFAVGVLDPLWLRYAAFGGSISLLAVGLTLIWLFNRQTNRYPFTGATKAWKWFYRDALPDQKKFNTTWGSYFVWGADKNRIELEYASQLSTFKQKISGLVSNSTNLDQDIEQLYVLHITEKYKNLFLSDMRTAVNVGMYVVLAAVALGAIVGVSHDRHNARTRTAEFGDVALRQEATWRPISRNGSDTVWLSTIVLSNRSKVATEPTGLVARLTTGPAIPLDARVSPGALTAIPPKSTRRIDFTFTTPSSLASKIQRPEMLVK